MEFSLCFSFGVFASFRNIAYYENMLNKGRTLVTYRGYGPSEVPLLVLKPHVKAAKKGGQMKASVRLPLFGKIWSGQKMQNTSLVPINK